MQSSTTAIASRHLRDLFSNGTVTGQTDGQLLTRYATCNDGSAFEALVMRHGPMVVATCRAVLQHEHDIEDAFQATFLVLARKAGSVRTDKALGGWLHRVAYRIAVQAKLESERRRRHESEAAAMMFSRTTRPGPDLELCTILHVEIDRLPERERLPVVLVDLEGLSYEQAAGRLGWTVPAVCYRLARARTRLRERLIRRGVTAPAPAAGVAMASAVAPATAALPAAWVRGAVALATGGPVPAAVAALSQTIIRALFMTQLKIAPAAIVAVAGFVYIGVVALGAARNEGAVSAPGTRVVAKAQPATDRSPANVQKDAEPKAPPASMTEFRGTVVDPTGKAVVGAVVRTPFVGLNRHINPVPQAKSAPDGRFSLRVPSPLRTFNSLVFRDGTPPLMVATAPGFGPGCWNAMFCKPGTDGELTIRLVDDGPPIEGHIVDLEGRPVAGANVKVERLPDHPVPRPGRSQHRRPGRVGDRGPSGRPRAHARGRGRRPRWQTDRRDDRARAHRRGGGREINEESPRFEVRSLDPSKPRTVVVKHEGRKLVGLVELKGDEPGPITVRLEPWGTITGRIVDDDGNPRGGLKVASVPIGRDGRFRFEGLVPGRKYEASAAQGYRGIGNVYRDVIVGPGELKDLGDLKVVPPVQP